MITKIGKEMLRKAALEQAAIEKMFTNKYMEEINAIADELTTQINEEMMREVEGSEILNDLIRDTKGQKQLNKVNDEIFHQLAKTIAFKLAKTN